MSLYNISVFLIALAINCCALSSAEGANLTVTDLESKGELTQLPSLSPVVVADTPGFKPAVDSYFSLNLFAFPEDVSEYCAELLRIFGERYIAYVKCLVPSARPVKVCQNCFASYRNLKDIYTNISNPVGAANVSCRDSLLRSDRLMLVYLLFNNMKEIWTTSGCDFCVSADLQSLTNSTLQFITALNQSLICFEKYQQQGNQSELCKECKAPYKSLNDLYSHMEKSKSLCIDIEDAMNVTRRLWSKKFNCSFPREETVPVIAVSSFMLFLPIIFYLSSFLHSEQKKRKLIHPKRAKSNTSLMNIQDKFS